MSRPDKRSPQAAAWRWMYKTPAWLAIRQEQLLAEPLCQRCSTAARPVAATIVHHRRAHKGDWLRFIDPENRESVCKPCHDGPIQSGERRGFSVAVDAEGWPVDPRHPANALG